MTVTHTLSETVENDGNAQTTVIATWQMLSSMQWCQHCHSVIIDHEVAVCPVCSRVIPHTVQIPQDWDNEAR